jgi:DNA replication protein DnaC
LIDKLKENILEYSDKIKNILIIGKSGSGKTLLLIKLMQEL